MELFTVVHQCHTTWQLTYFSLQLFRHCLVHWSITVKKVMFGCLSTVFFLVRTQGPVAQGLHLSSSPCISSVDNLPSAGSACVAPMLDGRCNGSCCFLICGIFQLSSASQDVPVVVSWQLKFMSCIRTNDPSSGAISSCDQSSLHAGPLTENCPRPCSTFNQRPLPTHLWLQ